MGEVKADKQIGLFFCVVAALGVVFIAYALGIERGYRLEHDEQKAHYSQQEAYRDIERSCTSPPSSVAKCAAQRIEATDDARRGEREVDAQEDASWWAQWSGIVGLITLGTTFLALYFVKGTLDATREAVQDTSLATEAMQKQNEIAETANRAWITIAPVINDLVVSSEKIRVTYRVTFQNIGKTIATDVHYFAAIWEHPTSVEEGIEFWRNDWEKNWDRKPDQPAFTLIPGEPFTTEGPFECLLIKLPWSDEPRRKCSLVFHSMVTFCIRGDPVRRKMCRAYRIGLEESQGEGRLWIFEDLIPEGSHALAITPAGMPIST